MLFAPKKETRAKTSQIDFLDGLEDVMQGDTDAYFNKIIKKEEEQRILKKEEEDEKRKISKKVFESAQRKLNKKEEQERKQDEGTRWINQVAETGWFINMFRAEFINPNVNQLNNNLPVNERNNHNLLGNLLHRFHKH